MFAVGASACAGTVSDGTGGTGGDDTGSDPGTPPGTPTPPPLDPAQVSKNLISQWSGCMTLDNFKTAKMVNWGKMASSDSNACSSCHFAGFEGFFASTDETAMFTAISTQQVFMQPFFIPDVPNNKMVINTLIFPAVGTRQAPYTDHPRFDPTNNPGMIALQAFYTSTMASLTAGTCGAPTIPAN
ncbi:MAG TPA: hypothetical protein VFP84_17690 [Kofleriaceae bacterium]|nr:hypothetical protein [Kofleriaceae bacterium]